jgi:hypothetical protein
MITRFRVFALQRYWINTKHRPARTIEAQALLAGASAPVEAHMCGGRAARFNKASIIRELQLPFKVHQLNQERLVRHSAAAWNKAAPFLSSFPNICPEPVLVHHRLSWGNWSKKGRMSDLGGRSAFEPPLFANESRLRQNTPPYQRLSYAWPEPVLEMHRFHQDIEVVKGWTKAVLFPSHLNIGPSASGFGELPTTNVPKR